MRILRLMLVLVVLAGVLASCAIPSPPCDLEAVQYPAGRYLSGGPLRLGVIDAGSRFPFDLPQPLKRSQASLAVLDDVRWGFIEPQPPQDGVHTYQWDDEAAALDTRVQAYQQAGFELVIVLRAWNTWARAASPQGGLAAAAASTPPQADFLDDYAAWVAAVVERYDGDGVDDFQGKVDADGDGSPDPVRYYQIETEAVTGVWWQGVDPAQATADYLNLLRVAKAAAEAAYPDVQILLAGVPALDMLDKFPSPEELEDVVTNIDPAVCGGINAAAQLLAASDAYDIAVVHSAADYSGLATLAGWMATLAGRSLPVWVNGGTSAPALLADPQAVSVNPLYPARGEGYWSSLENAFAPDHVKVESWYRAEQARLAFKKWVYAAWSGYETLTMGLEQDRPLYENPALGQRDLAFQGMLDDAGGGDPAERPVIPALALAQAQLSGYTAVDRIANLGAGVEAFRFGVEGLPVYVLWYDDGAAQGPDDDPVSTSVQLPVRAPQLTALTIPTRRGQSGPDIETLIPTDGVLALTLSETPLVLRGEWASLYLPSIRRQ